MYVSLLIYVITLVIDITYGSFEVFGINNFVTGNPTNLDLNTGVELVVV